MVARRGRVFLHLWEPGVDVVVGSGVASAPLRGSMYGGPGSDVVRQRGAGLGWHPVAGLGAERRRWRRVATAAASWISAVVSRWLRVSGRIASGGAGVSRRARSGEGGAGKRDISWGSHGRNMLSVEIIWLGSGIVDGEDSNIELTKGLRS